jgi:hypothetical protein
MLVLFLNHKAAFGHGLGVSNHIQGFGFFMVNTIKPTFAKDRE